MGAREHFHPHSHIVADYWAAELLKRVAAVVSVVFAVDEEVRIKTLIAIKPHAEALALGCVRTKLVTLLYAILPAAVLVSHLDKFTAPLWLDIEGPQICEC